MAATHGLLRVLVVLVTFSLAACGGGSGGSGSGTGTMGGTGTMTGNVSNQSVVMRSGAPPAAFARLQRWLSPAAAAEADIVNIHVRMGDLETDTDQNGFFILDGVPAGNGTVLFVAGTATFTMLVNVPAGEVVVLHDVVLANGMATPGSMRVEQLEPDDVDFEATVASITCPGSITVMRTDGEMLTVDLTDGFACAQLSLNQVLVIKGKPHGGVVVARSIDTGKD